VNVALAAVTFASGNPVPDSSLAVKRAGSDVGMKGDDQGSDHLGLYEFHDADTAGIGAAQTVARPCCEAMVPIPAEVAASRDRRHNWEYNCLR